MDVRAFASSLGLPNAPRIRFAGGGSSGGKKKAEEAAARQRSKQLAQEHGGDHHAAADDDDTEDDAEEAEEQDADADTDAEQVHEDDEGVAEEEEKEEEGGDDFLQIKRRNHDLQDIMEDASVPQHVKTVLEESESVKLTTKKGKRLKISADGISRKSQGSRFVFTAEGDALAPLQALASGNKLAAENNSNDGDDDDNGIVNGEGERLEEANGHVHSALIAQRMQLVKQKMQQRDKEDKLIQKRALKAARLEKKLKRKRQEAEERAPIPD